MQIQTLKNTCTLYTSFKTKTLTLRVKCSLNRLILLLVTPQSTLRIYFSSRGNLCSPGDKTRLFTPIKVGQVIFSTCNIIHYCKKNWTASNRKYFLMLFFTSFISPYERVTSFNLWTFTLKNVFFMSWFNKVTKWSFE